MPIRVVPGFDTWKVAVEDAFFIGLDHNDCTGSSTLPYHNDCLLPETSNCDIEANQETQPKYCIIAVYRSFVAALEYGLHLYQVPKGHTKAPRTQKSFTQ